MPAIGTFWTTNGTGSTNLIEATPGDPYTNPYTITPGSAGVDFTNPQVWIDASLIFGDLVIDPDTGFYPDRPDFDTATFADFMGWHSQHQAEFLVEKGTLAYSPDPGLPLPDPLPVGTKTVYYHEFTEGATMVLGQDGRTVHHVENLKLADFSTMSLADQEALAGLTVFQDQAEALLVRPASGETVEDVRTEMLTLVNALITEISATPNFDPDTRDRFLAGFMYDPSMRVSFNEEVDGNTVTRVMYPHFFVEELELYKLRLDNMALFNEQRINEFLTDLQERFDRIQRYHDVSVETPSTTSFPGGVNAFDAGQTMSSGIGIFVEMESQIFQIALARAYVVATGTMVEPVRGKLMSTQAMIEAAYDTANSTYKSYSDFLTAEATNIYTRITSGASKQVFLDGPSLVFVLQTFDNYEDEAEAQIKSEDLQQQSALLKDYSRMQELVNDTLQTYEPTPDVEDEDTPPETKTLLEKVLVSELSADEKRIAGMFDTVSSALNNTSYHPIEDEKSSGSPVDFRPTVEIAVDGTMTAYEKTIWDALAVRIGDATKIISQSSQIQMDEINSLNQQKNRHYELGSNTLNKMTELLREITS